MTGHENLYILLLFLVMLFSASVQLFYYIYFYLSAGLHAPSSGNGTTQPVSVIICARNEGENLQKFLPSVLEQDYPDYEVIVVNDCSEDNSYLVLGNFLLQYPHLKISTVNKDPKFTHNKKFAQFIGIKAARNEILLFTDADCQPESDKWISGMVSNFNASADFVLGYGGYTKEKGLLNRYIRYDSFVIAIQYLGMAIRGLPYMGVGRNLAYRRSLFFASHGFRSHNHLISGDDDLFVNANATGRNTVVETRRDTHTRSVPCTSLKNWMVQKKRHLTTAPYYRLRDRILLIAEPASRILFYASVITLLVIRYKWIFVTTILGLRLAVQIIVFTLGRKKLNEPGLLPFLLFFDIFSPLVNGALIISNIGSKPGKNRWR